MIINLIAAILAFVGGAYKIINSFREDRIRIYKEADDLCIVKNRDSLIWGTILLIASGLNVYLFINPEFF